MKPTFLLCSLALLWSASASALERAEFRRLWAKDDPASHQRLLESGDAAVPFLVEILGHPESETEASVKLAASCLGEIETAAAAAAARRLLDDPRENVRALAIETLRRQHPDRAENLASFRRQLEKEPSWKNRESLVEQLAVDGTAEDLPLLQRLVTTEQNLHVRLALWHAIAMDGEKDALLEIVKVCEHQSGHMGANYLGWVTHEDFEWNMPAWREWIAKTSDAEFKKLVARPSFAPPPRGPGSRQHSPALPKDLPAEVREAVEWFDSLGYPSSKDLARVRVTDEDTQVGGGNHQLKSFTGWLLAEKDGPFRILVGCDAEAPFAPTDDFPWPLHEWTTTAYEKVQNGWRSSRRIEKIRFEEEARAALAKLDERFDPTKPHERFGMVSSIRFKIFLLGRECFDQNLPDLGAKLLRRALSVGRDVDDHRPFSQALAEDAATDALWKVILDFGVPQISRDALLSELELAQRRFPSTRRAATMASLASQLRQMIGEDHEHARTAKPLESMAPIDQGTELVYQLRNLNGHQDSQPGGCNIFLGDNWKPDDHSPAARLVKLNHLAVPALIEALGDQRPTRSVEFWRNFTFSHHVLTVGDCAEQILERIAHRSFDGATPGLTRPTDKERLAAIRKEVESWWDDLQTKGERQLLIDAVSAGDGESVSQAEALLQRYPKSATGALLAGAQKAADDWTRSQLISLLAKRGDDQATDFLRTEVAKGPGQRSRLVSCNI